MMRTVSGWTITTLPSLRSITTRQPPRVSMRSAGFSAKPGVSANAAPPLLEVSITRPETLAARAIRGEVCAQAAETLALTTKAISRTARHAAIRTTGEDLSTAFAFVALIMLVVRVVRHRFC